MKHLPNTQCNPRPRQADSRRPLVRRIGFVVTTVMLTAMSAAADITIYDAHSPVFARLEPGVILRGALYGHDDASYQQMLEHAVNRVKDQAGEDDNRLVAIAANPRFLEYSDLSQQWQQTVQQHIGSADPEAAYEAQLSAFFADLLDALDGDYEKLTVVGLPFEDHAETDANNQTYAAVLARCDGFVSQRSFIQNSATSQSTMLLQALPNTFAIAGERPVFYRTNAGWRMAINEAEQSAPQPQQPSSYASFADADSEFALGASGDLALNTTAAMPPDGNVVFQTWSNESQSIEAAVADYDAPFVYPATALNTVTPGEADVQAIIRDSNDTILQIVHQPMLFVQVSDTPGQDDSPQPAPEPQPQPQPDDADDQNADGDQPADEVVDEPEQPADDASDDNSNADSDTDTDTVGDPDVANDTPQEPGPLAEFALATNTYTLGSGSDITLNLLSGAPSDGDVVFQIWSDVSSSVEAPFVDHAAPFVYPAAMLNSVTPGSGQVQAIIRDANDQIIDVVSLAMTFEAAPDWSNDVIDDQPTDEPAVPDDSSTDEPNQTPDTDNGNNNTDSDDVSNDNPTDPVGNDDIGSTPFDNNWGDPSAPSPAPVISIMQDSGMAPFTVHVHGLDSGLGTGDKLTARYEWNFGDPDGDFNQLVGWNAAHVYDTPGEYIITLRIINDAGRDAIITQNITVSHNTRQKIYVAADGNDNNPGTMNAPIRTFNRAMQMLGNDRMILFRRGDVFDTTGSGDITHHNWVIGAYGQGPHPVLRYTGSPGVSHIIGMHPNHGHDVVIQDVKFDSIHASNPARNIVDSVRPAGTNITVRNCQFGHVTHAIQGERTPIGLLTMNNITTAPNGLRAYYIWAQGTDHTHLGNVVGGSHYEHNMRLAGTNRVLVGYSNLTNTLKSCIWAMTGNHVYVTANEFNAGQMSVGPNHAFTNDSERFRWAVIERNTHYQQSDPQAAIQTKTGAEHVMIRNNVIMNDNTSSIRLWGYDEWNRTSVDVRILNNTAINNGTHGRFLECGSDTDDTFIANNIYIAPNLVTGHYQNAICYIEDSDLSGFAGIHNNIWPVPAQMLWVGDGYHYLWDNWGAGQGYRNVDEWNALPQTGNEMHANVSIDAAYCPGDGAMGHAVRVPGVWVDHAGNPRPAEGPWTAGAVEMMDMDH